MNITSQARPLVLKNYTRTAVALHWAVAGFIIIAFTVGLIVSDLPFSPQKLRWVNYHKWLGVTVLILVALRALWRLTHRPPELPPMPAWQEFGAKLSHGLMYTLMFAVPFSGWVFSSADGFRVVYLGLLPLPNLVAKNKLLADTLFDIHEGFAWTLCYVLLLHVAAAFKHHFLDRDDTLRRMFRWRAG
ncbi:MAG TPA: cytochrome b [Nevskia sp.]|nr:cytochrome b [Nevskia sp.]